MNDERRTCRLIMRMTAKGCLPLPSLFQPPTDSILNVMVEETSEGRSGIYRPRADPAYFHVLNDVQVRSIVEKGLLLLFLAKSILTGSPVLAGWDQKPPEEIPWRAVKLIASRSLFPCSSIIQVVFLRTQLNVQPNLNLWLLLVIQCLQPDIVSA